MSIWKTFTGFFQKKAQLEKKPEKPNLGASWVSPFGVRNVFPPKDSLDAFGEHAYLFAALQRTTEDLSALPLQVVTGKGKNKKVIDEHPVIELLNNPSSDVDGYLFRQQITLDLILSGTFFILMLGKGKTPTSLIRLHPEETFFVTDDKKGLVGVKNTSNGSEVYYPLEKVLYGRNPSYIKGPKSLYGTGAVQPLYEELKSDINAMMLASEASGKGRPDVLISPSDEADVWPKEVREEIVNSYKQMAKSGGAIALSGMAKIDLLNLSPREMEYKEARTMARQSISAAIGVPPSVLGLPDANYATSLNQKKTYWNNQIHRAKKLDMVYSKLAKLWDINLTVKHSFSDIEALDNRDKQLERIAKHIELGMDPADAYFYEGLTDAPFVTKKEEEKSIIDNEEKDILLDFFTKNIESREKKWKEWIEKKQQPAEIKFLDASKKYLKKSKKLILQKFSKLKSIAVISIHGDCYRYFKKDIRLTTDMIGPQEKQDLIDDTLARVYTKTFTENTEEELLSILRTANVDGKDITIDSELSGKFLSDLSNNLMKTTFQDVNKIINKGIQDNLSVSEIYDKIDNSKVFDIARAQKIARTEATKCINAAKLQAMDTAQQNGIVLEKEWLSERDDTVREAHLALDGQRVNVNAEFVVPSGEYSGAKAMGPCDFGIASLDVNCRCTVFSEVQAQE